MKKYAYACCILAAGALWGSMGLFVDLLASLGFSTLQTAFLRILTAAVFFVLFLLVKDRSLLHIRLRDVPVFLGLGIGSILAMTCFYFLAIRATSYSVAAILLYTAPVMVSVMSALFFKERFTRRKVLALCIAVGGCVLVSGWHVDGGVSAHGLLLGLLSGFSYALYSIFGKMALKTYAPYTVSAYAFVFALLGAAFVCDVPGTVSVCTVLLAEKPLVFIASALAIGGITAFLPYLLYTIGLSGTQAGKASILASVEPLVATLFGLLRAQSVGLAAYAGMVGILFSVILLTTEPPAAD